jgi:hypothetical protein
MSIQVAPLQRRFQHHQSTLAWIESIFSANPMRRKMGGNAQLIVSIHIPKTAGESFRARLRSTFGLRCMTDYDDYVGLDTPEFVTRRERRMVEMRVRKDELLRDYDVIHGHFIADKYIGLFPAAGFAAFFRDPYQQAMSHYQFLLRHPGMGDPTVKIFRETRMGVLEFIAAFPNVQSQFLGRSSVDDLAMVGVMEEYERSIALFEAVFGFKLAPETARQNVNPDRPAGGYSIDAAVRRAVDIHRAADVDVYWRGRARFHRLRSRYDV